MIIRDDRTTNSPPGIAMSMSPEYPLDGGKILQLWCQEQYPFHFPVNWKEELFGKLLIFYALFFQQNCFHLVLKLFFSFSRFSTLLVIHRFCPTPSSGHLLDISPLSYSIPSRCLDNALSCSSRFLDPYIAISLNNRLEQLTSLNASPQAPTTSSDRVEYSTILNTIWIP